MVQNIAGAFFHQAPFTKSFWCWSLALQNMQRTIGNTLIVVQIVTTMR